MKKFYLYLLFTLLLTSNFQIKAAVHTVTVFASFFSPILVSAEIGDSIKWVWTGGTHTTTSTSVPANAASWNSPLNSTVTEYYYPLIVAGNYMYKCTTHGFIGQIVVTNPSGISSPKLLEELIIYPIRPFVYDISYSLKTSSELKITVFDITGRSVKEFTPEFIIAGDHKKTLYLDDLQSGIYIVRLLTGNQRFSKRIIIE